MARKREAEELRNREEIEKFEKKFRPRRKRKDKYDNAKQSRESAGYKRTVAWVLTIAVGLIGATVAYTIAPDLTVFGS